MRKERKTEFLWYPNLFTRTLSLSDGCIVLELRGGRFQSLNEVGAAIWDVIRSNPNGISSEQVAKIVSQQFCKSVGAAKYVSQFTSKLADKKLILHRPDETPVISAEPVASARKARSLARRRRHDCNTAKMPSLRVKAYIELLRCGRILHSKGFFALRSRILALSISKPAPPNEAPSCVPQCCNAMTWAVSYFPYSVQCLQRSAALVVLLRKRDISASVVIGCEAIPFYSHAWVEVESSVVNDSSTVQKRFDIIDRWS